MVTGPRELVRPHPVKHVHPAAIGDDERFRFPQDSSWMRSCNSTGVSIADLSVNEKWHIVNQPTTTVAYTTTTVTTSPAHALPVAVVASSCATPSYLRCRRLAHVRSMLSIANGFRANRRIAANTHIRSVRSLSQNHFGGLALAAPLAG